jgi:two-component system chemotaxis response regulator CheB
MAAQLVEQPGIVALAASAGGPHALETVLASLDRAFPVPIVVVQHLHRTHPSLLAPILDRSCPLDVHEARAGEALLPATVYVGPPDRHLVVTDSATVGLEDSDLVHFVRPSADVLFASAAAAFGARLVAVVLTGAGIDGTAGIQEVKRRGGTVLAQDEATSASFGMPGSAIRTHDVDEVLPLEEIGPALTRVVAEWGGVGV